VAARLEHEAGTDPVIFREKVLATLQHGRANKRRNATAADDSNGVAACVSVDTEECMSWHGSRIRARMLNSYHFAFCTLSGCILGANLGMGACRMRAL